MAKKPAITLLVIAIGISFSQTIHTQSKNLVVNSSFEEYEKCPQDYTPQDHSHKMIPGWGYPTLATPDYFNRCSPSRADGVSVPKNFAGESEPHSGDGYAGAILSGTDDGYREYLQGTLSEPLIAGKQYCVTFYSKLASFSKFAVDQLSLYFSDIEVKNELMVNLAYKPQINNNVGLFLDNIDDWEETCTVYTARGGEKFFIIGNFKSYENTNYVATDKNMKNLRNKEYAYYFFDDVIIKPLDNCTDCNCVQHDFEAEIIDTGYTGGYNPITEKIERRVNDGHIKIGMIGGTPPYRVEWNHNLTGAELSNLPAGEYTYIAYDAFNCQSTGKVVFTEPKVDIDVFKGGLESIEEGGSIVLQNIFFEFNKTALLPESFPELDKVVDFMLKNNIGLIEISGHTDSDGSDTYNQKLSEGRARSVVQYLASKGVDAGHMKAVGYGESKPIDTNFSDAGKARNRRVEFTLLKK
ncbi:MAG: OmpA family protein [Bacteroidales bacterium]|nr:OmpA family protein [Bacteroidales bacterium]MBN2820195.1 OmpA family protein [Bacteroidales bacterium]